MAEPRDEIERALEEARNAREEADRLRRDALHEAERLRDAARDEGRRAREDARRLREEARRVRESERRLRHESRHFGPGVPQPPFGPPPIPGRGAHRDSSGDSGDSPGGVRAEQTFNVEGVNHVTIEQTAGRITIRACAADESPGVVTSGAKSAPQLDVRREGDRLVIEIHLAKGWLFRRKQGATTIVRLPGEGLASLKVDAGYGDLDLRDISAGELHIGVGAGVVSTYGTRGTLEANVAAGKLSVHGHAGLARCDTGTGDVLLDIAEVVPGEYRVDVGLGRAEVRLPEGQQVHIRTSSGIGKSRIEYPGAGEDAPTRVRLSTGIGEAIVKTRDGAEPPARPAGSARPQRSSRSAPPIRRREAEELRVLQMLEQGRITPQDAADLIAALQGAAPRATDEDDSRDDDSPARA
jgi:hypothetical protein